MALSDEGLIRKSAAVMRMAGWALTALLVAGDTRGSGFPCVLH